MYLCYLDESGTPELGSQTGHFVLVGLAIPVTSWQEKDQRIDAIKSRYGLKNAEIHTGYLARRFPEQEKVPEFQALSRDDRRAAAQQERDKELIRTAALKQPERLKSLKKLYRKNADYVHLTQAERNQLLREVADEIGAWQDARLFGFAIDKRQVKDAPAAAEVFQRTFAILTEKFQNFLIHVETAATGKGLGLLIEDNNETVARKITEFMRELHERRDRAFVLGNRIIETPLFVDSSLTSMVQMADLCAYATRRYLENQEADLFRRVFPRADFSDPVSTSLSHSPSLLRDTCTCIICTADRASKANLSNVPA